MDDTSGATFGPEQLGSISESFDQARTRLRQAGHDVAPGAAEELAALMLKLGANGLSGEELVKAAVRLILGGGAGGDGDEARP